MGDTNVKLPPGFRFHPSDEELVVHFLHRKASLLPCHPDVIPDLDLYPYDPSDLDGKAMAEGKMWYFYSRRTQNRKTVNGYWKPSGVDDPIFTSASQKVGMKKFYVFYIGEPPEGVKTNWIMHEYRLSDDDYSSRRGQLKIDYGKWVICRVCKRDHDDDDNKDDETELSCMDEVFLSLDDLDEVSFPL